VNWKNEAIAKLANYEASLRALDNMQDELARLKSEFVGVRAQAADQLPRNGRESRGDAALSNIVHREELKRALKQTKLWIKTVERALSVLDPEEKLVLQRFYIHSSKGNVQLLCTELGVEQTSVYRRRDNALRRFTTALYGAAENW